jgi:AraC-like DNA-binding protein
MEGQKDVRFADRAVSIDDRQAVLIASGNFLLTECIGTTCFKCLFFFFTDNKVSDFLLKHEKFTAHGASALPATRDSYFVADKDPYIHQFIHSLYQSFTLPDALSQPILDLRLEEILLYLTEKYKQPFITCLKSLLSDERVLSFRSIVEKNTASTLSVEEIAFLCNMSLSTFKRKFVEIYGVSPGKWLQRKRLGKAKELMIEKKLKASEIFMDFGYNNLSSFSAAFKNEFGYSPKEVG